jgi:hypothetical protein
MIAFVNTFSKSRLSVVDDVDLAMPLKHVEFLFFFL